MSSGMNRTQAEEYAKTMTYKQAISNIRTGKGIVYRKATMIKLNELAEIADKLVRCKDCKYYLNEHICLHFSRHGTIETSSYAYCAYGDRGEDGEA